MEDLNFKLLNLDFIREEKIYKSVLCSIDLNEINYYIKYDNYLSETELENICHNMISNRYKEFVIGRIASKIALQQILPKFHYLQWHLSAGVFSQPVVNGPGALGVSITHTHDAVMAIAFQLEHPLGIDLENTSIKTDASVIFEYCTAEEKKEAINTFNNEQFAALKLWTCKESLSKILCIGMMAPFKFLELNNISINSMKSTSRFEHFQQYQSETWLGEKNVFSISFPANSKLVTNDTNWEEWRLCFL